MLFIHLFISVFLAMIFVWLLVSVGSYRPQRYEDNVLAAFAFTFFLLFAFIWAGGVWLAPFGPVVGDLYWAPFLVSGILITLLIALLMPRYPGSSERQNAEIPVENTKAGKRRAGMGGTVCFVLIMLALLFSVGSFYAMP